jgi:hypothetical protein
VSQNRRAFLLALVALGVVIVAVLLLRPRDDPEPPPPAATPIATATVTAGSGTGGGGVLAPAVVAVPQAGSVDFTWSYAGSQSTDTFLVHVGTSADDAQIADPITLPRAAYTVKVRSGSPACLIATVVRDGQSSPASPAVCATAR